MKIFAKYLVFIVLSEKVHVTENNILRYWVLLDRLSTFGTKANEHVVVVHILTYIDKVISVLKLINSCYCCYCCLKCEMLTNCGNVLTYIHALTSTIKSNCAIIFSAMEKNSKYV